MHIDRAYLRPFSPTDLLLFDVVRYQLSVDYVDYVVHHILCSSLQLHWTVVEGVHLFDEDVALSLLLYVRSSKYI